MAAGAAKHKIVVVEDEGLIAADLEARLKSAGYAVPGTADSATKALALIRKTSPDLVLMDIRLKGDVDGIEIADQVRDQLDIPVVFLTAYEDSGTLERAGKTQAFGYIRKPIASASLRGSIEIALAKHRYERDLRAQRDWAIASFGAVPYAAIVTDRRGHVTFLNSRAQELTGSDADHALGRPCWDLLRLYYRQSGEAVQDLIPVAMLQGEPIPLPAGICRKRDPTRSYAVEGSVAPRWRDGRMEGAVVVLSDVTQSTFDEEQARQAEKQEALMRLAQGISTRLPAPGADGPGLIESLGNGDQSSQKFETIEKAAIDAFATASRLRAFLQVPEVRLEPVNLCELLQNIESTWKLVEPRLRVSSVLEKATVQGDGWQLSRALVSLLVHARTRMSGDTALTVSLCNGDVEQLINSARIRVSYATEESASALKQIFEPSWSGAAQDLNLAYKIVQKMGGIMATRLERHEAIFDIYLPRVEAHAEGAALPESQPAAVLLVDANAEVRRLLEIHFERHGLTLLGASGGEEALLFAGLYPGPIPLAILNLSGGEDARDWLPKRLEIVRPDTRVRLLCGYARQLDARAGQEFEEISHDPLTKWDLLEWARKSIEGCG